MSINIEDMLAPIVIGVTGHRDIRKEDKNKLKELVEKIFKEIKELCPHSPIILLSPLAEGADRLVAEAAFEKNIAVVVPCPMELEEYKKDFTGESLKEFNTMLGKVKGNLVIPLKEEKSYDRNAMYEEMGRYIAKQSEILIALWDGKLNHKTGGTSSIVEYKLKGTTSTHNYHLDPLSPLESGPVYHIVTPRLSSLETLKDVFSVQKLYPGSSEHQHQWEDSYNIVLKRIDDFNKDMVKHITNNLKRFEKNKGYVISPEEEKSLSSETVGMLNVYSAADTLSIYYQSFSLYLQVILCILAVTAVFFFEIYAHLINLPEETLILYPLTILIAAVIYNTAEKKNINNKYIDYRALAEGLRVQLFWDLSGIKEQASEYYLRKQKTEIEWIRNVIRVQKLLSIKNGYVGENHSKHEITINNWVKDQMKFYKKSNDRHKEKAEKYEKTINTFFYGAITIAFVTFILQFFKILNREDEIREILVVVMGLAPAVAAAIGFYSGRMAFSEHEKRYSRMADIFTKALYYIENHSGMNDEKLKKVIFELGKEALYENGDWVMVHRDKMISMPKG